MNTKKIIIIIFILIILLTLGSILFVISNNKKTIYCELDDKDNKFQINLKLNKSLKINYNYNFKTMDDSVDKYDEIKKYLKLIDNIEGVKTSIEQKKMQLNYYIDINLFKITKDDYELLGIKDIMNNNTKKDIINYYEKINYKCE